MEATNEQFTDDQFEEISEAVPGINNEIHADLFNSAGNTTIQDEPEQPEQPSLEPPKGKIVLGKLISGKSAVSIVNIFIPSFLVFAVRRFGYKTDKRQFKLTQEERDIMTPVVQECLNYVTLNFDNPFYALAFVVSFIYGSKVMDAIPDLSKIKEEDTVNNDATEEEEPTNPHFSEIRDKINSTSIRKEKTQLLIEAIENENPSDLIEMFKVYSQIYPERTEQYFRQWYERNFEQFPEHLRFTSSDNISI